MFIIGVVIYFALLVGLALLSGVPLAFLDFPSIIVILAISITVLLISGLIGDFFKGFKLMVKKENMFSPIELKRICEAIKLSIRTVLLSGLFGSLAGTVWLLAITNDASTIPVNFGVSAVTLLYAIVLTFVLLPVQAKAKAVLATLEQ